MSKKTLLKFPSLPSVSTIEKAIINNSGVLMDIRNIKNDKENITRDMVKAFEASKKKINVF